jgi:hypothetical protein
MLCFLKVIILCSTSRDDLLIPLVPEPDDHSISSAGATSQTHLSVEDEVNFFDPREYILGHYLTGDSFQGCIAGILQR